MGLDYIRAQTGKPWRKDDAEDLALPPGVPSQAPQ